MYQIVCKIYFFCKRILKERNEKNLTKNKCVKLVIAYCEEYFNKIVIEKYIKQNSNKIGINTKERNEKIIVSLTSYPKRINTVWISIETILRQIYKPDKIILWLSKEQFPNTLEDLPNELLNQQKRGLEIKFVDGDLKSHKKYYYACQYYKNACIILIDDDTFYEYSLIKKLVKLHNRYPKDIICMTAYMMDNFNDIPSNWHYIPKRKKIKSSLLAQAYTGSGTLLPPNCLDDKYTFNQDLIKKLCPYADDLWIKYMSYRKGTRVTTMYPYHSFSPEIYGTGEGSLWYINGLNKQNDQQWLNMINYFDKIK